MSEYRHSQYVEHCTMSWNTRADDWLRAVETDKRMEKDGWTRASSYAYTPPGRPYSVTVLTYTRPHFVKAEWMTGEGSEGHDWVRADDPRCR